MAPAGTRRPTPGLTTGHVHEQVEQDPEPAKRAETPHANTSGVAANLVDTLERIR